MRTRLRKFRRSVLFIINTWNHLCHSFWSDKYTMSIRTFKISFCRISYKMLVYVNRIIIEFNNICIYTYICVCIHKYSYKIFIRYMLSKVVLLTRKCVCMCVWCINYIYKASERATMSPLASRIFSALWKFGCPYLRWSSFAFWYIKYTFIYIVDKIYGIS